MQIREIKEEDLIDLQKLYVELCEREVPIDSMKIAFQKVKGDSNYHLLGAQLDGKIVGTLMGIVCYDVAGNYSNFMTVENVVVLEAYRGKGICKVLFKEIEEIARENHCDYIYLVSGEKRKTAHALYTKLGYADAQAKGFKKYL